MYTIISKITDERALILNEKRLKNDSKKLGIPYFLLYFLIYIEDKRFYYHIGVDLLSILRAFIVNKKKNTLQGGSTLAQQLYDIKQVKKGEKRERTLKRKIRQALFALKYSLKKSKEVIIFEYLENVYFGKNYYGIHEASKFYFKKEANQLNKMQCFILIERIAIPNKINIKRVSNILERKAIKNVLSIAEIQELKNVYLKGDIYG